MPNCPFYNVGAKLSGCQIVRFNYVGGKLSVLLSWCQIVRLHSWCQIVRLPSWCQNGPFLLPWCQIVQGQIVLPPAAADDDDDYDENDSHHEALFPQKKIN